MKVELLGANARQGKETVHLVGNRGDLVGRQGRHRRYWWSWLLTLTATHSVRDNDNGCLDIKLIKFLTVLVDDLSGSTCPIRTTSTWDYGVRPPRCSLVRKL